MNELRKCDAKQDAMRRLSDLLALKNYSELEIAHLIGMKARAEYVAAFVCSCVLNIGLEESTSCPFLSGIFADGPLKGASVQIARVPADCFSSFIQRCPKTDYFLFIGGRDSRKGGSSGFYSAWTIRSIYLVPSRDLMSHSPETGTSEILSDCFPDDFEIYPASKCSLLELTHYQRQLLDLFL